jgi:hypothetical protein
MEKNIALIHLGREITLEEKQVCKVFYGAICKRHGTFDPTNISEAEEKIIQGFAEEGFLKIEPNGYVITKEFCNFLKELFSPEEN